MRELRVSAASARYTVVIGRSARTALPSILGGLTGIRRVAVIADARVAELHFAGLREVLGDPRLLTFPPGEGSKTLETAAELYDRLAQERIGRRDLIVTFGGGVAGDLGGFVAATWLRGVRYIQVPTTIEAALDASIGGKTAVNHASGKNLIGAFHQPVAVVIDTEFLETLPVRDYAAGLAESIKHAVIRDAKFLDWQLVRARRILAREDRTLESLLARNVRIKAAVVSRDEREAGLRAILNYGHTLGHAFEHLLGYELRHGECVALGMLAENALAVGRQALSRAHAEQIARLIAAYGLPLRLPRRLNPAEVIEVCRMDKKNQGDALHFVLVSQPGAPQLVVNVLPEEIAAALAVVQPDGGQCVAGL